jgi:hemerythrin superfamily protein
MKKMDATRLLKQDHKEVKALFEAFEGLSDRASAKRMKLFDKIREELTVHAKIEEEIFYPAVKELRSKEAKERVAEANEEHAIVKLLLKQLSAGDAELETFKAKMKVLKDTVLHHAKEEEKEMFKEAKDGMETEALKELGAQLQARKEELLALGLEALMAEEDLDVTGDVLGQGARRVG